MKALILTFSVFFFGIFGSDEELLQGKWKLVQFDPFDNVIGSDDYRLGDDKTKEKFHEIFNMVLENTVYVFKSDTIWTTDYKNDTRIIRKGLFYIEGDKIVINYYDRIGSTAYRLIKVTQDELILELVYRETPNNLYARFEKLED